MAERFYVTSRSHDDIIESIECFNNQDDFFAVGVQWHPELMQKDIFQRNIFRGFIDLLT